MAERLAYTSGLTNPWDVQESSFPDQGSEEDRLRFLLNYAILAPSSYNTQPWLFRVSDNEIAIIADRSRALPVLDPDDRCLIMSCGAALMNIRIVLQRFGINATVRTYPDLTQPDLLAYVTARGTTKPTDEILKLFKAIKIRRTVRRPFESRDIPSSVLTRMKKAAADENTHLHVVTSMEAKTSLVRLITNADSVQRTNKSFRRELASWIHPNRSRSRDGLPSMGAILHDVLTDTGPTMVRTFDIGDGRPALEKHLIEHSPIFAILTTDADSSSSWLRAGQALENVLLHGAAAGLCFSYLNQPIEMPEYRDRVSEFLGVESRAQIILRMGYASRTRHSPRRPLNEVLVHPGYNP